MQALFKELHSNFKNFNKFSRLLIKYGGIIIVTLYALALSCFLIAGRIGDYALFMRLCFDFLECAKECIGAIFVPALLAQILYLADAFDKIK